MLYQLSHVRMLARGCPRPATGSLRRCVQNCIRSWRNHQLEAGIAAKNLPPERKQVTLSPPLTRSAGGVGGTTPPFRLIIGGRGADGHGAWARESPRHRRGASSAAASIAR